MSGLFSMFNGPEQESARPIDEQSISNIKNLLAENKKLEAIKAYREATGASLREAVSGVEMIENNQPINSVATGASDLQNFNAEWMTEVQTLLAQNKEIEAIKVYRGATGANLQTAVAAIKQIKENPQTGN